MLPELYEVSDARKIPYGDLLAPVVLLENRPGHLHVLEHTGKSRMFELTDENYEWAHDVLTIYTEQGMITFVPLQEDSGVLAFVETELDGLRQDCLR